MNIRRRREVVVFDVCIFTYDFFFILSFVNFFLLTQDVKTTKIEKLQSSLEAHELLVIEVQKDLYNKLFKHKHPRKREITRISRKKANVKQIGPTMESLELMTE
jgi:hypothetical protein